MRRVLFTILALSFLAVVKAMGATYYITVNGNDSATGTGISTAWRTIQKAANTVGRGDIVRVQAGAYGERVTETTAGTASEPITYIADGAVVVRGGFRFSGAHFNRLIGFEITQQNNPGGYNYETVGVDSATDVHIINCNIHHTDAEAITFRSAVNAVVRGCSLSYSRQAAYPWPVGSGASEIWIAGTSTNILIEYNHLSYSADYITGSSGSPRNIVVRNNRFGPMAVESPAHQDNIQPNTAWVDVLYEANWDQGNDCSDHHLGYWEVGGQLRNVVRGNVMLSNGYLGWSGLDYGSFYYNTFHENNTYGAGNDVSLACHNQGGSSIGNVAFNNIFNHCTKANSTPIQVVSPSACTYDYNLSWGQRPMTSGTHNLAADPLFVDGGPARNLSLRASSPAINAGGPITRATGNGNSSTSLNVDNAWALWPGDSITVGDVSAVIAAIPSRTAITLASPISWTEGVAVLWRGQRDLGAFPYLPGGYSYDVAISNPTGSVSQGTVIITADVTNPAVVRMVEFRVNGIPIQVDINPPFSANWNTGSLTGTHTVEAQAYYLFAAPANFWKTASRTVSIGDVPVPTPPGNLRVVAD